MEALPPNLRDFVAVAPEWMGRRSGCAAPPFRPPDRCSRCFPAELYPPSGWNQFSRTASV